MKEHRAALRDLATDMRPPMNEPCRGSVSSDCAQRPIRARAGAGTLQRLPKKMTDSRQGGISALPGLGERRVSVFGQNYGQKL